MNRKALRFFTAGLALFGALTFALTGCSDDESGGGSGSGSGSQSSSQ